MNNKEERAERVKVIVRVRPLLPAERDQPEAVDVLSVCISLPTPFLLNNLQFANMYQRINT